jgi:hypothetical protein
MYTNHNVGYVIAKEKYMRKLVLMGSFILMTGCSEFALLMSGSSVAISQNTYAKMYNAADFGVVVATKKGIKQHAYTQGKKYLEELAKAQATGKKYIIDYAKAKALGIMSNH